MKHLLLLLFFIPLVALAAPGNYTDYLNSADNINALSSITIAWDPNATDEQKLERIITQKWLAMFPEGQEACTEFRRTGYPALFPVVVNSNGGPDNGGTRVWWDVNKDNF